MIERILHIWAGGGWVMWPLLAVALMMFFVGLRLWIDLLTRQYRRVPESEWQKWIKCPDQGTGEISDIIRYVQGANSDEEISRRFAEVRAAQLPSIDSRLGTLGALVAAAPLVGLLGTVFGMLVTFQALALGGGGKITEAMADGISQALFPPEVGLCIALPGLVLVHLVSRQRQELEAFFARLESYTIQHFRKSTIPVDKSPDHEPEVEPAEALNPVQVPA